MGRKTKNFGNPDLRNNLCALLSLFLRPFLLPCFVAGDVAKYFDDIERLFVLLTEITWPIVAKPQRNFISSALFLSWLGLVVIISLCCMMGVLIFAYYADCDPLTKGDVAAADQVIRARYTSNTCVLAVGLIAIIHWHWVLLVGMANVFGRWEISW